MNWLIFLRHKIMSSLSTVVTYLYYRLKVWKPTVFLTFKSWQSINISISTFETYRFPPPKQMNNYPSNKNKKIWETILMVQCRQNGSVSHLKSTITAKYSNRYFHKFNFYFIFILELFQYRVCFLFWYSFIQIILGIFRLNAYW